MSNVKPAPIGLTESVVAKMVGDRPAYGQGVIHVPRATTLDDAIAPSRVPEELPNPTADPSTDG